MPSIGICEVLSISSNTRVDAPSAWMTETNVAEMRNRPALLLMEYRMNALSCPMVMSPSMASKEPYQNVAPSTAVAAAIIAPLNSAWPHPYFISIPSALSTDAAKCSASPSSRANPRTVRMAPKESSATAVASASAACVSLDRLRRRRPCHMATKISGGNAAMTTSVKRYEVRNMNARPMMAVARPRRNMERFCVATFLRRLVSAVSREMRLPLVTLSKNPTSCRRMLEKSLFRRRATTL